MQKLRLNRLKRLNWLNRVIFIINNMIVINKKQAFLSDYWSLRKVDSLVYFFRIPTNIFYILETPRERGVKGKRQRGKDIFWECYSVLRVV